MSDTQKVNEELLLADVDKHLKSVWPVIMHEWKESVKHLNKKERAIALITRDCSECGTRVRVGAVMNRLSPERPAGDRAFCAKCKCVTDSPIVEVRGLAITDSGDDD
jgi:hypothetical protein